MVIGRDYFTRQATILLNFAKATKDQKVAAGLIEKAADLKLQVDVPGARPDPSPLAAGHPTRKVVVPGQWQTIAPFPQLEAEGYPWIGCECCKGTVWVTSS